MARLVMMTTMATMTTIPFPTPMDGSNRHVWKVNTIPTTMPTPHLQVRHHGQHNRHPVGLLSLLRAHHRVHFPALPLICNYVHSNGDLLIYYIYICLYIYIQTSHQNHENVYPKRDTTPNRKDWELVAPTHIDPENGFTCMYVESMFLIVSDNHMY